MLLRDLTRRFHQTFIARPSENEFTERVSKAKSFVAEKWSAEPSVYSEFKTLKLPKLSQLEISHAELMIQNGELFTLGKDRYLLLAHNTQLSKTGRNISVVHGRSIRKPNEFLFVAYPEKQDLRLFRRVSLSYSLGAGPGDFFHGSLGVVELLVEKGGVARVSFIQSSVNLTMAIKQAMIPESYRRLYSGWAASLVTNVFSAGATAGWSLVHFPRGRVTSGLGEEQLNKLAKPWGYQIAAFNSDHDLTWIDPDITFVRVFGKNCQS